MNKSDLVIELNNSNNDPLIAQISEPNYNHRRNNYKNESIKTNQNICKRTTKLEKLIAVLILLIAIVFMILFLIGDKNFVQNVSKKNDNNDICYSNECIQSAADILNSMDQSLDPCDNFYDFACGNFIKTNSIPDDQISKNFATEFDDAVQDQVKKIILQDIDEKDIRSFQLVKDFYSVCMNTTKIEELGIDSITKISDKLGGWPVLKENDWNENSWNYEETIIKFKKIGTSINFIFAFVVTEDFKNTSKYILELDEPEFGIDREYLINGIEDEIVQYYYNYMVDIAVLFGANINTAKNELKESLEFEIKLAKLCVLKEERRNITNFYNLFSIAEIQSKYPYINWLRYFNNLLENIKINETEVINLTVPNYFKQLEFLLKTTPKKTISNYMLWRFYQNSAPFSIQKLIDRESKLKAEIYGNQETETRWKMCLQRTRAIFSSAVGALYVRKNFNKESKASVTEMFKQIQQSFKNIVNKVDWMDEKTRNAALLKLNNMNAIIAYPNELMDDEIINNYYEKLNINKNLFFESMLNISKFNYNRNFNKLREIRTRSDWRRYSDATNVNAYYLLTDNNIFCTAAILQKKLYTLNRPNYLNFGGIGFIIGHEITHGFDDEGNQHDFNGNLINWWAKNTKKLFSEKAQCIIDQYGNYVDKLSGFKLNGIHTQGENIADNGGVKAAYFAYKNWARVNGAESKLPGLQNFTSNQMFWISLAHTWCALDRPETLKNVITTDSHCPANFRILGSLSNMQEFSKDFNCRAGAKMNPMNKCEVW